MISRRSFLTLVGKGAVASSALPAFAEAVEKYCPVLPESSAVEWIVQSWDYDLNSGIAALFSDGTRHGMKFNIPKRLLTPEHIENAKRALLLWHQEKLTLEKHS